MRTSMWLALVLGVLVGHAGAQGNGEGKGGSARKPKSALDFTVKDIDGKPVDLKSFGGKVLMVVNVASL